MLRGGEETETIQWLVTLTFRVTVSGVHAKDDSVAVGLEQLKRDLCSGEDVPMEASVRKGHKYRRGGADLRCEVVNPVCSEPGAV